MSSSRVARARLAEPKALNHEACAGAIKDNGYEHDEAHRADGFVRDLAGALLERIG